MKKVLSIFGGIICFIICLLLFAIEIGFISFASVKTVVSKNSIKEVVSNVDVKELIKTDQNNTSDIYGAFDALGFSVEETDKILSSDSFKEFISDNINNNIDGLLNNEDVKTSYESIVKLVNDIESETSIKFENKEKFLSIVKEEYPEIEKSINISKSIKNSIDDEQLEVIKIFMGNGIIIGFIAVFIVIYFIMCILRWSIYKPLIWYGITTVASSFIMILSFLGIYSLTSLINDTAENMESIIVPILSVIKTKGIMASLIMLVVGTLMIVAYYFICKNEKEVEKNENFELLEKN